MKRIIGMIIWLGGLVALCIGLREGSDLAAWKMKYVSWFDVIMTMGFLGFFMSVSTLKMWKEMMRNEHNTEYYDVYYERGREVRREQNADAKLGGYFFTFCMGLFLAFVLSAVLSPFIFVLNLCMIACSVFGKRISILVVPLIVIGSALGGYWTYNYLDRRITAITQEREAEKAAERKVEEAQRVAEGQAAEAKMAAEREAEEARRRERQELERARRAEQVRSCRNCRGGGQVKVSHKCPVCNGRRRIPNPEAQAVNAIADGLGDAIGKIGGKGRNNRNLRRGNVSKEIRCTNCNGSGHVQSIEPCGKCNGTGKVNR